MSIIIMNFKHDISTCEHLSQCLKSKLRLSSEVHYILLTDTGTSHSTSLFTCSVCISDTLTSTTTLPVLCDSSANTTKDNSCNVVCLWSAVCTLKVHILQLCLQSAVVHTKSTSCSSVCRVQLYTQSVEQLAAWFVLFVECSCTKSTTCSSFCRMQLYTQSAEHLAAQFVLLVECSMSVLTKCISSLQLSLVECSMSVLTQCAANLCSSALQSAVQQCVCRV